MADQDLFTLTAPGRLLFPVLTQDKLDSATAYYDRMFALGNKTQRKPGWETTLVLDMDHPDLEAMMGVIADLSQANFDADEVVVEGAQPGSPLKDGSRISAARAKKLAKLDPPKPNDRAFLNGKMTLVARSKFPPALAAIINGKLVDLIGPMALANSNKFYSGVEALVQVRFAWYKPTPLAPGGGVNAFLNMVASLSRGTLYPVATGGRSATSAFKGYVGHTTQENPTADAF